MPTVTIEQDKGTRAQIMQIQSILIEIRNDIKFLKSQRIDKPVKSDSWLTASKFCRTFEISRPTLASRVERGLIEVKDFGEKHPRYRWVQEDSENALDK